MKKTREDVIDRLLAMTNPGQTDWKLCDTDTIAIRFAAAEMINNSKFCEWRQHSIYCFETSCQDNVGNSTIFQMHYKFCPSCGKKILIVEVNDEKE